MIEPDAVWRIYRLAQYLGVIAVMPRSWCWADAPAYRMRLTGKSPGGRGRMQTDRHLRPQQPVHPALAVQLAFHDVATL